MPIVRARVVNTNDCDASNAGEILGVVCSLAGLAVTSVCLRVYVRVCMLKFFGADDGVMIAASVMAVGTLVCFIGEATYGGTGKHFPCVTPLEDQIFWKWQYFHSLWVMVGVVLVKVSVALCLMRLVPNKAWKRWLWGAIGFLICFCLACAGTLIFSCVPIRANWGFALKDAPGTRCFSIETYSRIGLFNSIVGIITDFTFALLPIPIIVTLHMNRRTKVTLAFILSLGLVACAAGIVKARIQAVFLTLKDPTWHDGFNVWNMIELCLGIIAASLPALRPLFAQILSSTHSVLGMSGESSHCRSPNASGHKRGRDVLPKSGGVEIDLRELNVESRASDTTGSPELDAITFHPRSYNVRVHSGSDQFGVYRPSDSATGTRQGDRGLTPSDGIFKSTQVMRTFEPRGP